MAEANWDDVGKRFAELGRQLQAAWQDGSRDENAKSELRDASDKVKAALDDVASTINRTAASPEVQEASQSATSSLSDALASTLRQVAEWLERPRQRSDQAPRDAPVDPEP